MLPDIQRTIVALATAPQPAQRAIVRLAGPETRAILEQLCEKLPTDFLHSSSLQWCNCQCVFGFASTSLPVTVLYWPDHRSYTGGPAAEVHMIGCLPLAEAVINRCCELGAQPAARGEFTLRAFLSGKLDLAQAEAVLGVIEADSTSSLKAALSQLGGNLAPAVAPLRAALIEIVAELEAGLDFVDEDIQFISNEQVIDQLQTVSEQLEEFALRLDTRSSTDRVPAVVLTGLPNSGKSSLFNAICQQPLAIVADVPGTTRDYLQHRITLPLSDSELSFDLVDTAGWEQLSGTTPRALAQQQLAQCLAQAQLVLVCIDMSMAADSDYWQQLAATLTNKSTVQDRLIVGTKCDLLTSNSLLSEPLHPPAILEQARSLMQAEDIVITCCDRPETVTRLTERIKQALSDSQRQVQPSSGASRLVVVHETAVRCRAALTAARGGLTAALETARCGGGEELIAAELRLVLEDLATIIGEVHSDDVLGEIFSRFCIGK